MKGTDTFKEIISAHLQSIAAGDSLFAETLKKKDKNINDCITYILNTVKKSGCNGFADEEIFGMAIHYYDEDDINVGSPINGSVVVNRQAEAMRKSFATRSPEEKEKPVKKAKIESKADNQISLF